MASLRAFASRRPNAPSIPDTLFPYSSGFLQQHHRSLPALCRLGHSQSLWEELLGRKLKASTAKKLEDAFLEYKVEKAIPSWLPFFPNCSFWIPSNEETIKNLEVLAQRIQESRTQSPKDMKKSGKSFIQWSENINDRAISSLAWSLMPHIERLLAQIEASTVNSPKQQGTIIEVVLEDTDDRDATIEEEDNANKKKESLVRRGNMRQQLKISFEQIKKRSQKF